MGEQEFFLAYRRIELGPARETGMSATIKLLGLFKSILFQGDTENVNLKLATLGPTK
jgi:hypothetical protein